MAIGEEVCEAKGLEDSHFLVILMRFHNAAAVNDNYSREREREKSFVQGLERSFEKL